MSGEAQKESVKSLRITQNKDEAMTPEQVLWKEESINAIQTLFVSPPRDNTSTALPPALIVQLVARVAMEASKQLQPSIAPPLSQQSEVLVISSTFSLQVTVQVPVGQDLAARGGGDWHFNDENFRSLRPRVHPSPGRQFIGSCGSGPRVNTPGQSSEVRFLHQFPKGILFKVLRGC